jgi:hypothetical protein
VSQINGCAYCIDMHSHDTPQGGLGGRQARPRAGLARAPGLNQPGEIVNNINVGDRVSLEDHAGEHGEAQTLRDRLLRRSNHAATIGNSAERKSTKARTEGKAAARWDQQRDPAIASGSVRQHAPQGPSFDLRPADGQM